MITWLIVILMLMVLFLETFDKRPNEPFVNPTTIYQNTMINTPLLNLVESPVSGQPFNRSKSAMPGPVLDSGKNNKNPNYRDFTIIGKLPPDPIGDSCHLDFGCTNFPYDVDDINGNVCRRCDPNAINKNYNQLDKPIYVMGREAGRPRQYRRIN